MTNTSVLLKSVQQSFQKTLLDTQTIDAHLLVVDDGRLTPKYRFAIYQDAYRLRLEEALQIDYPALHALLGDQAFSQLCQAYIHAQPSIFRSVRWFGGKLRHYLRYTEPYSRQIMLAEMADFEWRLLLAFDAKDQPSATIETMQSFPPEKWGDLQFNFHPSIQRINLHWGVVHFRQQVIDDESNTPNTPQETEYPVSWLIWRQEYATHYRSMDVEEAWAFDAAYDGANFSSICEGLCEWVQPEHVAERMVNFLKTWLMQAIIVDIKTDTTV